MKKNLKHFKQSHKLSLQNPGYTNSNYTHMRTINGWINIEGFRELLVISFDWWSWPWNTQSNLACSQTAVISTASHSLSLSFPVILVSLFPRLCRLPCNPHFPCSHSFSLSSEHISMVEILSTFKTAELLIHAGSLIINSSCCN